MAGLKRIPIIIQPFFWITAALIGYIISGSLLGSLVWVFIILVSVLVHELGHAFAAAAFGKQPTIRLTAFGGATSYELQNLSRSKEFVIVLTGPFFGFLLFLSAFVLLQSGLFQNEVVINILTGFQNINLLWTVVNLIPVLPLDGGHLLRITLEGFFGIRGYKAALFIGLFISLSISFFFFIVRSYLAGAFFFLFAFQSFDLWRRARFLSSADRKEQFAKILKEGEDLLAVGKLKEAASCFEQVREKTGAGGLFTAATFYLAMISYQEQEKERAYHLLLTVKEALDDAALCLLHELAFEAADYRLVADLSAACYKADPTETVALRNARAYALLKDPKPAGGWLKTATDFGRLDVQNLLAEKFFEGVKDDPLFRSFFNWS